ncbi:interferon-induced GTP-binding protein Mx-like [Thalassophryne amazonica]|uniref:interferon-induced GTP-binding protein Mx-like n=1 Tax=Thalassophryne amazonica TaxID=390379 RepID=UPI001470CB1E|nr:interferon-induced GTP-binding protein Mx-like [Thalassophryne amazonica]
MKKKKAGEKWHGKISYKDYEEELEDPADVEDKILHAQDQMAGVGLGISDDLISLEIASPEVPDLTLIDLPGIARVALKGQPENIGDQIKRMIQKFITKQETISLVVVPANVDIATTEALKMAQEVDPDGERTLGILTKPDLVDKGTEEIVVQIVQNDVIPLKKGYMIVRCRGQQEISGNVSLIEAIKREEAFFKDHVYFRTLYEDGHTTVPKLAEKLTLELVQHIEKSLPRLWEQTEKKLAESHAELNRYGTGAPCEAAERRVYLIDKVTEFTHSAVSLATGEELKYENGSNIFSDLRSQFCEWNSTIVVSGQNFSAKCEQQVTEYEQKYRGRELPGFINYKSFEELIRQQIRYLEEPAVRKLKDVSDDVKIAFCQLAENSFIGFPNLIKTAKTKIETIRKEKEITAESMLRTQFKMELIIYTQDNRYSGQLLKRKREDEETASKNRQLGYVNSSQQSTLSCTDSRATLKEMMKHLKSYYQIVGERLADQIPMMIRYHMLQESALQLQKEMLPILQDKELLEFLLQEDSVIKNKRIRLQKCITRLTKARVLLAAFFSANVFPLSCIDQVTNVGGHTKA